MTIFKRFLFGERPKWYEFESDSPSELFRSIADYLDENQDAGIVAVSFSSSDVSNDGRYKACGVDEYNHTAYMAQVIFS